MRHNSLRQTAASRSNGSKSKGPKSPSGKSKSAQNAIQRGLFSRQVVIEELGEKQSDFEQIKNEFLDFLQPSNPIEKALAMDVVENWWRRERIRRSEAEELSNWLEAVRLRQAFERLDKLETLRMRFTMLLLQWDEVADRSEIVAELQTVRQELLSTPEGITDLIKNLEILKDEVRSSAALSTLSETVLHACVGFYSDAIAGWNLLRYRDSEE